MQTCGEDPEDVAAAVERVEAVIRALEAGVAPKGRHDSFGAKIRGRKSSSRDREDAGCGPA